MTLLASSSGTAIYEDSSKLYITKSSGTGISTFIFVTGILAVILSGNGILQLTVLKDQFSQSYVIGPALLGAGLLAFLVLWRLWVYQKKKRAMPPQPSDHIAIIDRINNTLLNGRGLLLAQLNEVFIVRKMQLTSSSPELLLQWPGGSLTIVKGNPFSGRISAVEQVLLANGMQRK